MPPPAAATIRTPIIHDRKHVGGILRCASGGYFYTHGMGEPGQAPVKFSIAVPAGCTLASLWHTHGGPFADREYFSPADTRSADTLGKTMFMTNHTDLLFVYHPGGRKVLRLRTSRSALRIPLGLCPGRVVTDSAGLAIRIPTL